MEDQTIKLTAFSKGAGCGCKIAPQVLDEILKNSQTALNFPQLLIGNTAKDDAAVYQLDEQQSLIATTDFFTPIVDDPLTFGKIAAANAISDVYAMGGKPIVALAILGWPVEKLPITAAQKVLEGARFVCDEAGIPLAGGHSIDTSAPIFGLSVNGIVGNNQVKRNNTVEAGDFLLLTKPIGVGIFTTAEKRGLLEDNDKAALYEQLTKLNKIGTELAGIPGVNALTDVTGFGLAGHLLEMCQQQKLKAEISFAALPLLKGVSKYLTKNCIPDASYRNWKAYGKQIEVKTTVPFVEVFQLLPDPQTNGGLLISVSPNSIEKVQEVLVENNYEIFTQPIGKVTPKSNAEKSIIIHP